MLFRQWDGWRRRRAERYLALSPEQRYRKHQWRQIAAIATVPGILLGTGSVAAAYGTGLFTRTPPAPACQPTVVLAPARGSFPVTVLNATGEGGRATDVGKDLLRRHFKVTVMTNAPEDLYIKSSGAVYHGADGLRQALLVQSQLPGSRLFDDGRRGTGVALVIGSGFTALVPPPARDAPRPSQIVVNVYNTTYHEGLAKKVQDDLVARGFKRGKAGNDPAGTFLPKDVALIRYGVDGDLTAKRLAEHVAGARLVRDDRQGTGLDLVIGNGWTDLVPFAEVPALPPLVKAPPETVAVPCARK